MMRLLPLALLLAASAEGTQLPATNMLAPPPAAPDYDDPANWVQVTAVPKGASRVARNPVVDVVYLHPTTIRSDAWNMDPADPKQRQWTDESAIERQASAFSACCRIFAPRYRAATYGALQKGHMADAFALAYADVERAFDWYLAHENHGRPFILAGHSQGAAHIATLVEKRIDGTPLQRRLVAAYIIGINLMEGEFGLRFKTIRPCAKPADTGCILQWNSVEEGSDTGAMTATYAKMFKSRYGDAAGDRALCINPVTFDADRPSSTRAQAKGAVPGEPGAGPMPPLRARAVAVRCENGLAVVQRAPDLDMKALPGGSLHYHDIGLFWADIRANALLRAKKAARGRQ